MNVLSIVSTISDAIIATGVGAIVGNAIKATTPIHQTTSQKVLVAIGAATLTSVSGKLAADHVRNSVSETVDTLKSIKTPTDQTN